MSHKINPSGKNNNNNTIVINLPQAQAQKKANTSPTNTQSLGKQKQTNTQSLGKQRFPISGSGSGGGSSMSLGNNPYLNTSSLQGEVLREQLNNLRNISNSNMNMRQIQDLIDNKYNNLYLGTQNAFKYLNDRMDNFDVPVYPGSEQFVARGRGISRINNSNDVSSIRPTPNNLIDLNENESEKSVVIDNTPYKNIDMDSIGNYYNNDEDAFLSDSSSVPTTQKRAQDALDYFAEDVDEYNFSDEEKQDEVANEGKAIIEALLPSSLNKIAQDVVNKEFKNRSKNEKANFLLLYSQLFGKNIDVIKPKQIKEARDLLKDKYGFEEN